MRIAAVIRFARRPGRARGITARTAPASAGMLLLTLVQLATAAAVTPVGSWTTIDDDSGTGHDARAAVVAKETVGEVRSATAEPVLSDLAANYANSAN